MLDYNDITVNISIGEWERAKDCDDGVFELLKKIEARFEHEKELVDFHNEIRSAFSNVYIDITK